ncbi:MAG: hypothetical protein JNJ54_32755 [Myxococcaceae bacterium]|nr:hypothetical protein [Myxococcaceae bacterium]
MDVVTIARQSLRTAWQHRALWLFGFFIAASGGGGGGGGTAPRGSNLSSGALPGWLLPALVVAALLGLAALVMHVVSEGALIAGVQSASQGGTPTVRSGLRAGLAHFGVVFRLKLLALVALVAMAGVVLLPVGLGVAALVPLWAGALGSAVAALALLPAALTGYLVLEVALRVAVLEQQGAVDAVGTATRYLSGRLLDSLQLLVVAFVGQAGVGLLGVLALVPGALVGGLVWLLTHSLLAAGVALAVVAAPLLIPVIGFAGAFRSTVWTTGFLASRAVERG